MDPIIISTSAQQYWPSLPILTADPVVPAHSMRSAPEHLAFKYAACPFVPDCPIPRLGGGGGGSQRQRRFHRLANGGEHLHLRRRIENRETTNTIRRTTTVRENEAVCKGGGNWPASVIHHRRARAAVTARRPALLVNPSGSFIEGCETPSSLRSCLAVAALLKQTEEKCSRMQSAAHESQSCLPVL